VEEESQALVGWSSGKRPLKLGFNFYFSTVFNDVLLTIAFDSAEGFK